MHYPAFFDAVEKITLFDPLGAFLGAFDNGIVEFSYLDAVKFAGHSCPTVAGAFLMAKIGLANLFKDELPKRGEIAVALQGAKSEGVNGVIGNTIAYICGVSDEAGFKGIGGHFDRSNNLTYNAPIKGQVSLTDLATNNTVTLSYDPSIIPPDPQMKPLMQKIMSGQASEEEKQLFRSLWQERVKKILLSKELWPQIIKVS
ncbi:FmdE family protein [Nitratiruptor sp. YY09-18]|uniref:FmdE family protein n=1 Tax=Nitratiruptor sp. YY09-18 TaxID=2724901 RepID=UPI001915856F|nr:FmdE family protein [Nitratiruptor sp. YY09-18]BCD68887.1 hypothetical protein NitYY0918_C1806 [Nitratiruptor sp. YY09-18]